MVRESILQRSRYLKIASKKIAEGMKIGGFRSCFRGSGMEFDSVREYEFGDDVRSIDWNVSARTHKTFVKMYREERELTLFLLVDASLSMRNGNETASVLYSAFEAAALLAFAGEQSASPVGAVIFNDIVKNSIKPRLGKDHILRILSLLDAEQAQKEPLVYAKKQGTALESAIRGATSLLRSRSLVVIISDFRVTGYEESLSRLGSAHDVIALRCTHEQDATLPSMGVISFTDRETGITQALPTSSTSFRVARELEHREAIIRWKNICVRRGVTPALLSADDDPVIVLSTIFLGLKR